MSSVSRGGLGLVVGVTLTAVACGLWPTFPDDLLHPDNGLDGGLSDGGLSDGAVLVDGALDASVIPDAGGMDARVPDAAVEAGVDSSLPDAGPSCGMLPATAVPSRVVVPAAPTGMATDFAFDGRGGVALAAGTGVDLVAPGGSRTPLVTALPGTVVTVRYAPTGDLVMALVTSTDGGVPTGIIAAVSSTGTGFRTLAMPVGRPGGLAVDAGGHVWFSDGVMGTITRFVLTSTTAGRPTVVSSDVPGPTALAFDNAGTSLYVASAIAGQMATVYQVTLMPGDMDTVTALPARAYAGGLTDSPDGGATAIAPITGLAVDQCGYLYATDQGRNQIWRVDPTTVGTTFLRLVTDIPGPTGLAFGQGGAYDGRTVFSLDGTGALRGAGVTALGVTRPTPP